MNYRSSIVMLAIATLGACSDSTSIVSSTPHRSTVLAKEPAVWPSTDEVFASIADHNPAFGGAFYSGEGELTIISSDTASRSSLESAVRASMGRAEQRSHVKFVVGKYSFRQLVDWKRMMNVSHNLKGVVFTDADERTNRVTVAVVDATAESSVRNLAKSIGVPEGAIRIVRAGHPSMTASSFDRLTPLRSGLALTIAHPNNSGSGCTIGVVAGATHWLFDTMFVSGARYAITASHCFGSTKVGITDTNEVAHQWTVAPLNRVGHETLDKTPVYSWWFGCPSGRVCKESDAAAVRLERDSSVLGWIGQFQGPPTQYTQNSSQMDTTYDPSAYLDRTRPFGPDSAIDWYGRTVHKFGAQSGWTAGPVAATCVDMPLYDDDYNDTGITLLCQNIGQLLGISGDSGSLVAVDDGVWEIAGIMWGSLTYNGYPAIVYSTWGWVSINLNMLGNLTVAP